MNTPSEKKGNLLEKVLKALLAAAFILSVTACPPATGGDPDPKPIPVTNEQKLIGTWAYDYGYDQEKFAEEILTLKKDKTFYIDAKYYYSNTFEEDKGTYEIVNDSVYGQTLKLHITQYKNGSMQDFSDCNAIISFKCTFDDDDTLHLDRFKQDFSNQGGAVYEFDPVKENTYYRITGGTKNILTSGKWTVIKNNSFWNNYDCSWTFSEDGTMVDYWTANETKNQWSGEYKIIEENNKTLLYQKITMGEDYYQEWWYNFTVLGPNQIHVVSEKHTTNGKEDTDDGNMFFYREVETETFNYHVGIGTFKHMVPKADSYTLINHPWQLDQLSSVKGYEFLGWYDNKNFTGNPVSTVTDNKRDFYAKFNLVTMYETYENNDGSSGSDYYLSYPAIFVLNDEKELQMPEPGDNISILFEATLTEDIDGEVGMNLSNYNNGWKRFSFDYKNIKTSGKKIREVFNFTVPDNITLSDYLNDYCIIFYYLEEGRNKANTFSDWKYTILDDTDSYKITYNYGDVSFVTRGLKDSECKLPSDAKFFEPWSWNIAQQEFLGWYDNPELTETSVTSIPAGNTADKTYYAKFNPKIHISSWKEDDGSENHNYNTTLPVKALLPGKDFNPKAGDTISVYFEANISHDLNGWGGLRLVDETNGWNLLAQDWSSMKTEGNKLSKVFNIKIDSTTKLPSIENLCFDFGYDKNAYDEIITFSDWKFVLLDETNSYKITYNFGDVSYVARVLKGSDFELPKDSNFFEHINWNIAQSTEILGWYENEDFSGNAVTKIPAGNTADKTYYAKFNLKGRRSGDWEDNGKMNHDYHVTVPVKALVPGNEFNPKPGDTVNIYFEATLSNDLNQWAGWHLQSDNGWIARDVGPIVTSDKKLSKIFTIKIDNNVTLPSVDELYFDFWYSKEAYDGIITFSDWKFVLLDETNSYSIIYHFGNIEYEEKQLTAIEKTLPDDMLYFEKIDWNIGNNLLFGGWYDNPEWTGASLSTIAANSIADGGTKDVYLNIIPKMNIWTSDTDDVFNYNTHLPAKLFLSESSINSIKNMTDTIFVNLTATVKDSPILHENGYSWFTFIDSTDWSDVATTYSKQATCSNGKINITYKLNKIDGKNLPDPEDMLFSMGFNDDFYGDRTKPIELNDITVVLLDETNSYNINYHFGNMVYTEREYTGNSFTLPTDLKTFGSFDWNIANNTKFVEWKEGSASGSTITEIPVGNTTDKDVYLNYKLKLHRWGPEDGNISNNFPLLLFLTADQISEIYTTTGLSAKMGATLPQDFNEAEWNIAINDNSVEGWNPIVDISGISNNQQFVLTLVDGVTTMPPAENLAININFGEVSKSTYGDDYFVENFYLKADDGNKKPPVDTDGEKYSVTAEYTDGKDGASWVRIYDYEETVTLSVTASAKEGNIAYQWYSYEYSEEPSDAKEISGATSSSYTVPNDDELDKHFFCRATNESNTDFYDETNSVHVKFTMIKEYGSDTINTSTSFYSKYTYYITGTLNINSPLTIDEGTVIKFSGEGGLNIQNEGYIIAYGFEEYPICFTSYRDNSVGCTIPNTSGSPEAGDWKGLKISGASESTIFENCIFEYAGSSSGLAPLNLETKATVKYCTFRYNKSQIQNPLGALNITGNAYGSELTQNVFYGNDIPLSCPAFIGLGTTNVFHKDNETNNKPYILLLDDEITKYALLCITEIPYLANGNLMAKANLSVNGDVVVKFKQNCGVYVYPENGGDLAASGDCYFTSVKDDAHGGDTNGDGSLTQPAAGDWKGIWTSTDYWNNSYNNNTDMVRFAELHN